ncbi:hypothetical protein FB451DRAFT_1452380 [Mycena latifolia]|nr:hypothetical protein FB451DRAFT_1452380 [Mycena latifolia]
MFARPWQKDWVTATMGTLPSRCILFRLQMKIRRVPALLIHSGRRLHRRVRSQRDVMAAKGTLAQSPDETEGGSLAARTLMISVFTRAVRTLLARRVNPQTKLLNQCQSEVLVREQWFDEAEEGGAKDASKEKEIRGARQWEGITNVSEGDVHGDSGVQVEQRSESPLSPRKKRGEPRAYRDAARRPDQRKHLQIWWPCVRENRWGSEGREPEGTAGCRTRADGAAVVRKAKLRGQNFGVRSGTGTWRVRGRGEVEIMTARRGDIRASERKHVLQGRDQNGTCQDDEARVLVSASGTVQCGRRRALQIIINVRMAEGQDTIWGVRLLNGRYALLLRAAAEECDVGGSEGPAVVKHIRASAVLGDDRDVEQREGREGGVEGMGGRRRRGSAVVNPGAMGRRVGSADSGHTMRWTAEKWCDSFREFPSQAQMSRRFKAFEASRRVLSIRTKTNDPPNAQFRGHNTSERFWCRRTYYGGGDLSVKCGHNMDIGGHAMHDTLY